MVVTEVVLLAAAQVQQAQVAPAMDIQLIQVQTVEAAAVQATVMVIAIHGQDVVVEAEQVVQVLIIVQHTVQVQVAAQDHVVCVVIETHLTATDVAVTQDTHTKQAEAAMAALAEHVVDLENRGQTVTVTDIYAVAALVVVAVAVVRHTAAAGVDLAW